MGGRISPGVTFSSGSALRASDAEAAVGAVGGTGLLGQISLSGGKLTRVDRASICGEMGRTPVLSRLSCEQGIITRPRRTGPWASWVEKTLAVLWLPQEAQKR